MNQVRLNNQNVHQYLGYMVQFNSPKYGGLQQRQILGISDSGNSIKVDFPELGNSLNISNSRRVFVIIS
mgnify:CR=1 FL=1